jgi:OmpA-OmpF porin, OOP family
MKKLFCSLLLIISGISPLLSQEDKEGCKDPALFTRMPNFHIYNCEDLQFDKYEFPLNSDKKQAVEGHYIYINYYLNDNAQAPSGLQIVRNYTNAIRKIGGKLIYEFEDGGTQYTTLQLVKDKQEIWAQIVGAGNGMYSIYIVEKEAMNQDVAADANSMAKSIKETGKVAVYGIYFDTGKSVLKAESKAALDEISKLLKTDPKLKLYVVGHTDNAGVFESNLTLSNDRALAVMHALITEYSVSADRLRSFGDGPTSPMATNDTEEGKALNRRVELVKQ